MSVMVKATEGMIGKPGVEWMEPGYRRLHRTFVLFNAVVPVVGLALAGWALWGWGITALDLGLMAFFYVLTTLGITVGFHRMLAHRGFEAPAPVRAALASVGTLAMQGQVITWIADHRRHHAFSDQEGDPHSPHVDPDSGPWGILKGLWWAHIGWMFAPVRSSRERWAPDLLRDPVLVAIDKLYVPHVIVSLGLPPLIGFAVTGTAQGALTAFLWGSLARVFLQLHMTWSINSICHVFGSRSYETRDEAGNVWWLALPSLGESWHNNHHAFPSSVRHGLDRLQVDVSAAVIAVLERLRLARKVSRPDADTRARRRLRPGPDAEARDRQPAGV